MTTKPTERLHLPAPLALLAGFLMGAADSVPGVSGGTIALVLGIYERFIRAISRVLSAPKLLRTPDGRRRFLEALRLLVPLEVGLLAAIYLGTKLLVGPEAAPGLLRRPETAPLCFAFFFGLVVASLREPWRRIEGARAPHVAVAVVCAGLAALAGYVGGLPHAEAEPPMWTLLYGGAAAISVMLLPGVSGSLMLVVLGQYTTVAGAPHDGRWDILGVFSVGVVLGLLIVVPPLRYLLRRHHGFTMAGLTGLMAGSLWALWPWKEAYDPRALGNVGPSSSIVLVVVAAVAGALAARLLVRLERRMAPPAPPAPQQT